MLKTYTTAICDACGEEASRQEGDHYSVDQDRFVRVHVNGANREINDATFCLPCGEKIYEFLGGLGIRTLERHTTRGFAQEGAIIHHDPHAQGVGRNLVPQRALAETAN
jgi:hypothetical protein